MDLILTSLVCQFLGKFIDHRKGGEGCEGEEHVRLVVGREEEVARQRGGKNSEAQERYRSGECCCSGIV